MDAVMALVVALAVFTLILGIQNSVKNTERAEFKRIHYIAEDAVEALNKKGVLDEIGTQWALSEGNSSSPHWVLAANLSQKYLSGLIPSGMGYKLLIDDDEIFRYEGVPESGASTVTRSARMLSGYRTDKPVYGFVARAYFSQIRAKTTEKYINMPFIVHGSTLKSDLYVVYKFDLPDDAEILYAEWVLNKGGGNEADLYLNGAHVDYLNNCSIVYRKNVSSYLQPGTNTVRINMSVGQYEGSYIVVRYKASDISEDLTLRENLPYVNSTETSDCMCATTPGSCDRDPGQLYCYHDYPCCGANNHTALFLLKVPISFRGAASDITSRIHAKGLNNFINVLFNSVPIARVDFDYDMTEHEYTLNLTTKNFTDAGVDLSGLSGKDNWLDVYIDSDCDTAYDSVELLDDSYIEVSYAPLSPIGYGDITFGKYSLLNDTDWEMPSYGFSSWNFSIDIPENAEIYDAYVRAFYGCRCAGLYQNYGMQARSDTKSANMLYLVNGPEGTSPIFYDGSIDHQTGYFHFPPEYISQGGEDRYVLYRRYPDTDLSNYSIRDGSVFFVKYKINAYVPYGDPKSKAAGSNITVWYDSNQDGTAEGSVNISVGENPDDYDPENDAVDDAVMRLLDELNFYNDDPDLADGSQDNPVDVEITPEMNFESSNVGDVRSMWGPAILKLVVWM